MARKRCRACNKFSYSESDVLHAAIGTTRAVGVPVRYYACPANPKVFHLTTKMKGENQRA